MPLLHELFMEVVAKYPDKSAIAWDDNSCVTMFTYYELLSAVEIVVNELREEHVQYEYIGVQMDNLVMYPALVLGILQSGCAYVLLDSKNDIQWNLKLLDRLNVRVILSDNCGNLTENWSFIRKMSIHNNFVSVLRCNRPFIDCFIEDNFHMAYAIQTSGTTGKPKVVQVPHRCIVPNILQLRDIFEVGPSDTVFLSSPITFDPSVVETFITLTSGACLLITPDSIRTAPGPHLLQFLFRRPRKCGRVSILSLTPSYAACLLSAHSTPKAVREINPELKILCLGGEPCPSIEILKKWRDILGRATKVFSLYGVTEVSCWASISEVIFPEEHCSKLTVKRKVSCKTDTSVQLASKNKTLKLDSGTVKEQDLVPINDSNIMTRTISESEVLPSDHSDSDVVNSCVNLNMQPSEVKQEVLDSRTIDSVPEVSLGVAMDQTILEVRASSGHTVYNGEGELYIGSDTRVCLLDDDPVGLLRKGGLIFRATGDIVRVKNFSDDSNSSSVMFYKGRRDGAVKRFGQWIFMESVELAAEEFIWNCDAEFVSVDSACCVWHSKEPGRGKLGLFVKPSDKRILVESELLTRKKKFIEGIASHLTSILPTNSWPDVILPIEEFPLTNHGKVDRENLLDKLQSFLSENHINSEGKGPKKSNELLLNFKSLWMKYLLINHEPSPSDKFLQSGGDSLLALRLVAELEDILNCAMPPMLLIKLINGTFEEACTCIQASDLELGSSSSSFPTEGGIDQVIDSKTSDKNEEGQSSAYYGSECEAENSRVENVYLSLEYTRGKVLRHFSSSEIHPTHLTAGKSPVIIEKWKHDLGKCIDASPVVLQFVDSKSIVVVGSHSGIVAAIDVETGEQVFQCVLPDRIESSACSSPCGKFVFVGCYDHRFYCISIPEGKIIWSFGAEEMVKSSPLIVNNGTSAVFGSYSGYLYCLNIKQGDMIWKVKPHSGSIYSSPALYQESTVPDNLIRGDKIDEYSLEGSGSTAISSGIILCGTLSGICTALSEGDGRILWKNDLEEPIFASPLVYGSYAVLASVKGKVVCFSVKSGKKVWSFLAGGNVFSSFTSVEVENKRLIIFGCHDHYTYCLSGDGALLWKSMVNSPVFATPFIFPVKCHDALKKDEVSPSEVGGHVSNLLVVCSTAGHLYILDSSDGVVLADMKVEGNIFSSPVVVCDHIVFGCRNNFLYCFTVS